MKATKLVIPQYGTRRRLDRPTFGQDVADTAGLFGITLKPWQQHVVDVLLEHDGDGNLFYDTGVLSVGRRAGKTLLVFLMAVTRLRLDRRSTVWFTAQDERSAATHFRNEYVPLAKDGALSEAFKIRLANGSESITYEPTGSKFSLFSPRPSALHGFNSDMVIIDECWKFHAERGRDLEVGIRPTMWTRPGAQLLLTSAAGDTSSTWWAEILDAGREAVQADADSGTAHFEWTVDGTELDPHAPDTWRLVHPGGLPDHVMLAEYNRNEEQFLRTMLNITDRTKGVGSPIDHVMWQNLGTDRADLGTMMTLGVDVNADQTSSAIVACMQDGRVIQVFDHRPGTFWVVDRLVELFDKYNIVEIITDPGGPAGVLVPGLQAQALPTRQLVLRDVAAASAGFASAVATSNVRHVPDASLDMAVAFARKRPVGDGAWTISRRNSVEDPCPLTAAMFAMFGHPDAQLTYDPNIR